MASYKPAKELEKNLEEDPDKSPFVTCSVQVSDGRFYLELLRPTWKVVPSSISYSLRGARQTQEHSEKGARPASICKLFHKRHR